MWKIILFFTVLLFLFSCSDRSSEIEILTEYMTGSFSSQDQSKSDTNFYDIRLEHARIWKERSDGYWLYVEQAAASSLDEPYRQRVYHVIQKSDSLLQSTVYTLNNPAQFTGAWKDENPLADLSPENLMEREGCAIILKLYAPGVFVGSTASLRCDSQLRGAAYATSIVLINKDQIYSWDRGFDMSGTQVWGAQTGGYVFKRVKK